MSDVDLQKTVATYYETKFAPEIQRFHIEPIAAENEQNANAAGIKRKFSVAVKMAIIHQKWSGNLDETNKNN